MKKQSKKLWIILGVCVGIAVLCVIFFWLLPTIFQKWLSEEEIERFLAGKSGWRGLIYLALLQAAQVVSIFFPGAAVQIAGGLVFGTLKSYLVCMIAFVGTNVGVFLLAKRHSSRPVAANSMLGVRTRKVLDWINSSDPFFMCMLAYMMPGIPNGFVPYAAARTNVTPRRFAFSVLLGSLFQVFIMCSIGSRIMSGDFAVSFVLVLASLAMIFVLYKIKDKLIAFWQQHLSAQIHAPHDVSDR